MIKVLTNPRDSAWLTRLFFLVRGWGLGTRLLASLPFVVSHAASDTFFLLSIEHSEVWRSRDSHQVSHKFDVSYNLHIIQTFTACAWDDLGQSFLKWLFRPIDLSSIRNDPASTISCQHGNSIAWLMIEGYSVCLQWLANNDSCTVL